MSVRNMMRKLLPLLLLVVVLLLDHLIQLNDSFLVLSVLDPLSAVGLGFGAISGIGNIFSSSHSNSQNMKINKMNNEFNAREAEKARQYQTEMWNKTMSGILLRMFVSAFRKLDIILI